jgi:hypothetical protein
VTGPFTATLDLGGPFKVQTEPFALANAVATAPGPITSGSSNKSGAKAVLIVLSIVIAGALAFTYRKRPTT